MPGELFSGNSAQPLVAPGDPKPGDLQPGIVPLAQPLWSSREKVAGTACSCPQMEWCRPPLQSRRTTLSAPGVLASEWSEEQGQMVRSPGVRKRLPVVLAFLCGQS